MSPKMSVVSILLVSSFLFAIQPSQSFPLSTHQRWLVDDATGHRVKLACVNWVSHVGPMLAVGLDKKPLRYIADQVAARGYNCVRLTWATYMWTRPEYANMTVEQSFDALNLTEEKAGLIENNNFILRMTLPEAFVTVVDVLGAYNLMVVADNHVSFPIWCCASNDGNGFWGDEYFNPEEWVLGLVTVARRLKGRSQLVGIGMRNELRGPRQNVPDWFKYFHLGATRINEVNPDVLTIASGLNFATNLTFLIKDPLDFTINNKFVLEAHQYGWGSEPITQWVNHPVNQICASRLQGFQNSDGFILTNGTGGNQYPLFFGETGINQEYTSLSELHFMDCFITYMAENDMDWGLWALQGSYYYRENKTNVGEQYGIMTFNWDGVKNPAFQNKLSILKHKLRDPSSTSPSTYLMFHPLNGACVHADERRNVYLRSCSDKNWSHWIHGGDDSPIKWVGTDYCLQANGEGQQVILSTNCTSPQSLWRSVSPSKFHLATKDENGEDLCLHMENDDPALNEKIVTKKCICIGDDPHCLDDPTTQWFKLVKTNVYS